MLIALAAGLLCALIVPPDRPGIGWALAFLVLALLALRVRRSAWAIGAIALVAAGSWRSASWVFVLCLGAGLSLLAVSVRGGRSFRELASALPAWLTFGVRSVPGQLEGAATAGPGTWRIVRATAIGVTLLVIFGWLLSSADVVFADFLSGLRPDVTLARFAGGAAVFMVATLLIVGISRPTPVSPGDDARTPWRLTDWAIPLGLLNLLFLTFAIVQFTVLFGGHTYIHDNGPTYAQYARGGFLQLGIVTALTLLVLAVVLSRLDPRHVVQARVLAGALCVLTLVIVLSALRRMQVYTEAFGFTRSRLFSVALIIWLGVIFLLIMAVGLGSRRTLLPRLVLAAGALVLLSLAVINPDRYIARTVIARYEHDGHLDAPFLTRLSPDALAEIERLPEPKRSCIISRMIPPSDPWYAYNPARAHARSHRQLALSVDGADCFRYLNSGYRLEGNWTDPK